MFGPLAVSVLSIKEGKESKLAQIGVRDSKLLTARKREFLFDEIYSISEDVKVYKITNDEINTAMTTGMSLNELEALTFARLIDSLETEPSKVFLDSPDVIADRFGMRVSLFSKKLMKIKGVKVTKIKTKIDAVTAKPITIISEHKADSRYPVVSGASIIAKVTRDEEIERIKEEIGVDIGSGYPSDNTTIDVIKANLENDSVMQYIRQRWKTLELIRQTKISDYFSNHK